MSPNSDSHDPDQTSGGGGNLKIIDLEFETLRQFREVMASRLNYEGFFVATKDPLPKGTPARFRFLLPDGFVLIEGTAVVAWARFEDKDPDQKAGMALIFNELEHQSREIIDELIDFHIATGGNPFEIGPLVSDAGDIGTDALAGDPLETKVPLPEPEPTLEATKPEEKTREDVLPDWLSEVAQKNDGDLTADATVPVGEIQENLQIPESPEPVQQDFEISLMPDEEEVDPTPAFADDSAQRFPAQPVAPGRCGSRGRGGNRMVDCEPWTGADAPGTDSRGRRDTGVRTVDRARRRTSGGTNRQTARGHRTGARIISNRRGSRARDPGSADSREPRWR